MFRKKLKNKHDICVYFGEDISIIAIDLNMKIGKNMYLERKIHTIEDTFCNVIIESYLKLLTNKEF